jgi:hypothetical protein
MLEMVNKFCTKAGHKLNIWKSVSHSNTNNKCTEKEIKKRPPFTWATKSKTQGKKPNKDVKDLYNEKYKTLKSEI